MGAADIELQKFCLIAEAGELPEHIRKLKPGDKTSSCDGRNTLTVTRVPGGLQVSVVLRGGMPCYAVGAPRQAQDLATGALDGVVKIFEASRSAERFVAVDDSRFDMPDKPEGINEYFEDPLKIKAGDDIINVKAEEVKDERKQLQ